MSTSDATTAPEKPRKSLVGTLVNLGLIALAFALLAVVIYQNREKLRDVFSRKLDLRLLVAGIAIFHCSVMLTFVRWYALVRVIEPRFTLRSTFLLGFIGYVFNLVIPGAVGGDLIKAAYLVRMHIRKTQAVASMVIDRILGLMGLFLLASIAGVFAWSMTTPAVQRLILAAWIATGAGFALLAAVFGQVFSRFMPASMKSEHSKLGTITTELNTMSSTYRSRLDVVLLALGLSVVGHTLNVFALYLMGRMLFPDMSTTLGQHYLMGPLTLFTMAVPLPFGALGFTEGAADQLFNLVGHPSGALAMMGFRILMYSLGLTGAVVYLLNLKEVRGLTTAAHEIEHELIDGDLVDEEPAGASPLV
ncbi:lysylphosphatidylglycerol synthase transmembrane domain-containing protein [Paludisphaera rhizosphaerae]|uniref:lysylphosphatidylglycerol synthase transmembrane domain-containing protein n=1 Tax=Paludisphaera rhizosphaerae TaxID=2711216 RepID=UPI0013EB83E3|nr:lysylphosphatidylglycerol synthase transmembrane domain-containing protein [Paludisphaera rhizosphaerae]